MNDKLMLGSVAVIGVLLAIGSAAVLISSGVSDGEDVIIDDPATESALGIATTLENAPDYTKYVLIGALIISAGIIVRRETC